MAGIPSFPRLPSTVAAGPAGPTARAYHTRGRHVKLQPPDRHDVARWWPDSRGRSHARGRHGFRILTRRGGVGHNPPCGSTGRLPVGSWLARKDSNLRSPDPESGTRNQPREPRFERAAGPSRPTNRGESGAHPEMSQMPIPKESVALSGRWGFHLAERGSSTARPQSSQVMPEESLRQIPITSSAARRGDSAAADSGYPIRNAVTPAKSPELRRSTAPANKRASPADTSRSARSNAWLRG
jgi:hypothetical protein